MLRNLFLPMMACLAFVAMPALANDTLPLASQGTTEYRIVRPGSPTAADQYAINLLVRTFHDATGADLPVVDEVSGPSIIIGRSQETMGEQEYVVRTDGRNILLYGEGTLGNLHAVTAFMERGLGWRWFSARTQPVVPHRATLHIEPLNLREGFSFRYRKMGSNMGNDFQTQQGINMGLHPEAPSNPGPYTNFKTMERWIHTLFMFVPPDPESRVYHKFEWLPSRDYFKTNPEYFSLASSGDRVANLQLCLSNTELRRVLTTHIIEHIKRDGDDRIVDLSAMDNPGKFCHCVDCQSLEAKYNSPGGPLYDYLFELCDQLKREHPATLVHTIAYRREQTQTPPTMPSGHSFPDNLIIEFCPIEDNFYADWSNPDPKIQQTYADLKAWGKLTPHLWVFMYPNPWGTAENMPVATTQKMINRIRQAHQAGVEGYFADHNGINARSAFAELQSYLIVKLLQNVEADTDVLVTEFTDHYYGSAGKLIRRYLGALEAGRLAMKDLHDGVTFRSNDYDDKTFPHLTTENIHRWQGWFDQMNKLTADEPEAGYHVRLARRELDIATLLKWFDLKKAYPDVYQDAKLVADRLKVDGKAGQPDSHWVQNFGQDTAADFLNIIAAGGQVKPLPSRFAKIDPASIKQLIPTNYSRSVTARTVLDPDAAFGYATTVDLPDMPFHFGFYQWISRQPTNGVRVREVSLSAGEITPGQYQVHHLGMVTVTPDCWIWFSARSWATHLQLGSRLYRPGEDNKWEAYVSMKYDGPSYGGTAPEDQVLVDRIILVPAELASQVLAAPAQASVSTQAEKPVVFAAMQDVPNNLLTNGNAESEDPQDRWTGSLVQRHEDDRHSGAASLMLNRKAGMAWGPNFIEIDPKKTYQLAGWMKSTNPQKLVGGAIDCRFFDEQQQEIKPFSVLPITSIGKLSAPAAKGDREVEVAATGWPATARLVALALDVKEDLADLPNARYFPIQKIDSANGRYQIHLVSPLDADTPAGTAVRINRYLDNPRAILAKVPAQWTRVTITIKPYAGSGPGQNMTVWPGTRYIKVAVLGIGTDEQAAILFDDITLTEVAP